MAKPTSVEIHDCLHSGTYIKTAKKYLKRRSCPPDLLTLFASEEYTVNIWGKKNGKKLARYAIRNPKLPREEIEKYLLWSKEHNFEVSNIIALFRNPALTTLDIKDLIDHSKTKTQLENIYHVCGGHFRFPSELLEVLEKYEKSYIRAAVAGNRAAPSDLLTRLVHDENYKVQIVAIKNPATPKDAIANFIRGIEEIPDAVPHVNVLRAAMDWLPEGSDFQKALRLLNMSPLDTHSNAITVASYSDDPKILKLKAIDTDPSIRAKAISNPHTPEDAKVVGALMGTPLIYRSRGVIIKPRRYYQRKPLA